MPKSVLHLLQDEGSVQSLDDEAHLVRKKMFMRMMGEASLLRAVELFRHQFLAAVDAWAVMPEIQFHTEIRKVLTRTALIWSGIASAEGSVEDRAGELGAMVDEAGGIGPANWWARHLRNRSEAWAGSVIEGARHGNIPCHETSPLSIIVEHRDVNGKDLDTNIAAVELLNVLRPTVAIDRFIVFAALALHERPDWAVRLRDGSDADLEAFVLEVRRFYPFFPVISGKVREEFEWNGYGFRVGQWVLFDLYGTNHHAGSWKDPMSFDPGRFLNWKGDPYTYVAQGAGGFETSHRCPGEWLTIAIMKEAVRLLVTKMEYEMPVQDVSVDLHRMPAQPKSGLLMRAIRSV